MFCRFNLNFEVRPVHPAQVFKMSNELHEETQLDDLYMALNDEIFDHNMEIEQDLDNILSEVCFNSNFSCDLCCKVYKTKYGLKRHKTSKHEQINSLNEEKDSI